MFRQNNLVNVVIADQEYIFVFGVAIRKDRRASGRSLEKSVYV